MSADKIADRVLDVCRRLTLLAGTAVLAAGGSLPALSAMASDNGLSVHADDGSGTTAEITPGAMVARVEERGRLPVIVELRVDVAPDAALGARALADQRAAIATAQRRVLSNVPGAINVKRYRTVPFVAMSVDAAGMRALMGNASVLSVAEDIAVRPTLAQSVPLIRADVVARRAAINGGKGWAVVVLDTGVQRNHPAFRTKIVAEACFSTTDASQGSTSFCPGGRPSSTAKGAGRNCPAAIDGCFHGTHVAGIAIGNPRNSFKGVARGADLIPMQVFSRFSPAACGGSEPCVSAFFSDVIAAMERVIVLSRSHRIASVNLSLGGGQFTRACNTADATMRAMTRLIRNLSDRRIATVIASGNDGSNSFVNAPGCISTAVTVGSTTKADSVSGFSNHTRLVDLMAPGSDITAPILGSRFGAASGTSMATPHVAGAWALMRKAKPTAPVAEIQAALTCGGVPVVRNRLRKPRIDLLSAVNALRNGCP